MFKKQSEDIFLQTGYRVSPLGCSSRLLEEGAGAYPCVSAMWLYCTGGHRDVLPWVQTVHPQGLGLPKCSTHEFRQGK